MPDKELVKGYHLYKLHVVSKMCSEKDSEFKKRGRRDVAAERPKKKLRKEVTEGTQSCM